MSDLTAWVPKYLMDSPHALGGQSVSAAQWNELWLLNQLQGDDTASVLKQLVDQLYASVLHPTTGAAFLTNLAISVGGSTNVGGQILELRDRLAADEIQLADIRETVLNIAIGVISAYPHSILQGRDLPDAHPIESITGLEAALQAPLDWETTHGANTSLHPTVLTQNTWSAKANFKKGVGTFPSNHTTHTVTDAFITADTLVIVSPTLTKLGKWEISSAAGSFTITSSALEILSVTFDWGATK